MAPASPNLGRGAVLLRKDGKTGRCPVYDQASLGTYPLSRRLPLGSSVPSDGCAGRSHSILRRVILSEDREPGWTFQDHGLREKGNPGRRDAAVMGQTTPKGKRRTRQITFRSGNLHRQ